MAQLAQAYIHLQPYTLSSQDLLQEYAVSSPDLKQLGRIADAIAQNAALRIYARDTEVDVRLEQGSLKVWVTVLAALWSSYQAVSSYKGFKESVAELCKDAREFSVDVCGAFTHGIKVSPHQVFRTEKRLKTPGKINRLIKRLETLDAGHTELSDQELRYQLSMARQQLDDIESDLDAAEVHVLTNALRYSRLPPVADFPRELPRPEMPRVAISHHANTLLIPTFEPIELLPADRQGKLVYRNTFTVKPNGPRLAR